MTKVKIETLTSTHVDSGNVLFHDNDFVRGADLENNPILGIVDMRKAMNLIGERNIGAWVAMIDRGVPISDVIKRYAPRANVLDYSCRTIHAGFEGNKRLDLREFIHDGLGRPYLPGSSIKGAIRTAILSALANNMPSIGTWQTLEKNLFGKEPQSDIFRFIHVGDALFSELEDMYAFLIVLLNERKSQDVLDCSKKQLVEVLGPKSKSSMDVEIDEKGFSLFRNNPDNSSFLKSMSSDVRQVLSGDIRHMFSLINSHTSRLVDEEIEIWEEKERYLDDDDVVLPDYIDTLKDIKAEIGKCNNGTSCVLRLGFGSGWRFITGAWTERLKGTAAFDNIKDKSRPKNRVKYYEYDFPKSRRIEYSYAEPLGFVKLSL